MLRASGSAYPLRCRCRSLPCRAGWYRVGQRSMTVVEPLPLTIVRSGRTLVRQGDPTAGPWLIETGILRASLVTSDGRELVVDLLGPRRRRRRASGDDRRVHAGHPSACAPAGRRGRRPDHGARGACPPSLHPGVRRRVARRRHASRAPTPGSGGPVRPPGSWWDGHPYHASPGRPGRTRRHVARDRQPRAPPADQTGPRPGGSVAGGTWSARPCGCCAPERPVLCRAGRVALEQGERTRPAVARAALHRPAASGARLRFDDRPCPRGYAARLRNATLGLELEEVRGDRRAASSCTSDG